MVHVHALIKFRENEIEAEKQNQEEKQSFLGQKCQNVFGKNAIILHGMLLTEFVFIHMERNH